MAEKRVQFAVANLGSVSEVLQSTPLLESLRQEHPSCRITYIVGRGSAEVLDYSPFINEIVIWPDSRSVAGGLRLVRQLARKHFDGAYTLISNSYVNAAFRLSRSPIHNVELPRPGNPRLHYTVTATEQREATMMLDRWNIDPTRETVIAIHPGAPLASFVGVAHYVSERPQLKAVLLGNAEEREAAAVLTQETHANIVDLTSCLSFREFVAVLSLCHLLVHSATEPMYLANAVGVPVLSITGEKDRTGAVITELEKRLAEVNAARTTHNHRTPSR